MTSFIRHLVSGNRNRYVDSRFNLDLTYITPKIIAMSTPSTSTTSVIYRNPLEQISKFFNSRHKNHYLIFNLSEMIYDKSLFNYNVQDIGFPDHFPPTLTQLFTILRSIDSWMMSDERNCVAVHCRAGKSRTGLVICAYLLWKGEFSSVGAAVKYFLWKRGEGIGSPSQILYLKYFFTIITEGKIVRSSPLHLRSIYLHGVNQHFINQMLKHRIVLQIFKAQQLDVGSIQHILVYSTRTHDMDNSLTDSDVISFSVPHISLDGDIIVICKTTTTTGSKKLFRFAFHTGFIDSYILRLRKADMDHAFKDNTFGDEFMIDLMFLPGAVKPSENIVEDSDSSSDEIGMNAMRKLDERSRKRNRSTSIFLPMDRSLNYRFSDENQLLKDLYGIPDLRRKKMRWIKLDLYPNREKTDETFIKVSVRPSLEAIYNEEFQDHFTESNKLRSDYRLAYTLFQESIYCQDRTNNREKLSFELKTNLQK